MLKPLQPHKTNLTAKENNYHCLYCKYFHTDLTTFRKHLQGHRINRQQLALQVACMKLQAVSHAFKQGKTLLECELKKR